MSGKYSWQIREIRKEGLKGVESKKIILDVIVAGASEREMWMGSGGKSEPVTICIDMPSSLWVSVCDGACAGQLAGLGNFMWAEKLAIHPDLKFLTATLFLASIRKYNERQTVSGLLHKTRTFCLLTGIIYTNHQKKKREKKRDRGGIATTKLLYYHWYY